MKTQELYNKAIDKNGSRAQIDMFTEEAGELLSAINKFRRERCSIDGVCQEIADVMIMCEQLAIIFDEKKVANWKAFKQMRLEKRLKGKDKPDGRQFFIVRDVDTCRIFEAEYSEIAGEWYERYNGHAHGSENIEVIKL